MNRKARHDHHRSADVETRLDIRPLSGVGAEIHGIDLREQTDDATIADVRSFATRFGELTPAHPVIPGIDGYPEVFEIDDSKAAVPYAQYGDVAGPRRSAVSWRTDVTFVERPPTRSLLNAFVIPAAGGDTLWSNQVAAFEAVSPAQDFLSGLRAVHDGKAQFGALLAKRDGGGSGTVRSTTRCARSSTRS